MNAKEVFYKGLLKGHLDMLQIVINHTRKLLEVEDDSETV